GEPARFGRYPWLTLMDAPRITIPVIDIAASFATIRAEVDEAIKRVLDAGSFVLGPELAALEDEFAKALNVRRAIGVNSGTDALHLALRAAGVGRGDLVAVPALTFFATAEAVVHAGATPLIVDVDERTATMSPEALEAVADRVKAVIPVHLYGHPADMDAILSIAGSRGVAVIEDACQAIGARYKGVAAGAVGDAAAFSFYPTKNIGGAGDGGMVTTKHPHFAATVKSLRHHAQSERKDFHDDIGYNSRLDDLQAAILRVKLRRLDEITKARRQIAAWYHDLLAGLPLELPHEADWAEHVYHLFVVRCDERERVAAGLHERGVGAAIHYPIPLTQQPAINDLGCEQPDAPVAEAIARRQLTIPMYPEMTRPQVEAVAAALKEAL
ncbi:MAG TPA: DegT/DnrJ/EryC1/StrS family aminotransferase, partial [Actinomycetota bacterium]|nr:DegT/DnrJ/EryC1/StrS family aminotransferase [Actinomycetota bacterium]